MSTMHRRISILLFFVLILALLLQGCGSLASNEPTPTPAPVKVKVVTLPFITFAPFYIALEDGYFAEQGLDVELVDMRVQEEILPALSSGQVDVTSGLLSVAMLNTIARGSNVKITADKGYVDPQGCINYAIAARRELVESGELDSPAKARGLKVNIVPATWLEFYLDKVLQSGGLTLEDIEKFNLSAAAMPDALQQGTIDMAVNSEPWITRFIQAGHMPVFSLPQEILPDSQAAVILFGPKLLGENKEAGQRFMVAYLKATRQYNEGKTDRNLEIIAKFTQLEPAFLQEMCWPAVRNSGDLNVASLLEFQQWAVDRGYLETPVTPEQFWDGSFIESANQTLDAAQ